MQDMLRIFGFENLSRLCSGSCDVSSEIEHDRNIHAEERYSERCHKAAASLRRSCIVLNRAHFEAQCGDPLVFAEHRCGKSITDFASERGLSGSRRSADEMKRHQNNLPLEPELARPPLHLAEQQRPEDRSP